MKKLFFMLFALFFVYLLIQSAFTFFSKKNLSSYIIKGDKINFEVTEDASFDNNNNFYAFTVKANNTFKFQIDHSFSKGNQVINSIKHYQDDNTECILPLFKNNEVLLDIICYENNQYTFYYNLKGKNAELDKYVLGLKEYKLSQFTDILQSEEIDGVPIYKRNLIDNHYIAVQYNKGILNVSKDFNSVIYMMSLYSRNEANPKLSAFTDEYYVVADYNRTRDFNKISVVNLTRLKQATSSITANKPISMNSYIQGVVDGKVYLYDKDNKIQYEIMPYKGTLATHKGSNMKYYNKGTWEVLDAAKADDGILFAYEKEENTAYDRYDKVGSEIGYYYMYKKNGDHYDVYRRSIQDEDSTIYLFATKTINHICYVGDYVYFVNGKTLQVYNNEFGVRSILEYNALENINFEFNVYAK